MDDLNKMQMMLTEMLHFFHDFCEENSLCYYAVGGTALGVVRHQGFIPWDDDIDVGMPRKDYNKFVSIFNKERKNHRYILESQFSKNEDYCYTYSKLYDTKTYLVEPLKNEIVRGLYIDIFPLDGVGSKSNPIIFPFLLRKVNKARALLAWPTEKKAFYISFIRGFIILILELLFKERKLRLLYNRICQVFDYDTSKYVGNLNSPYGKKEIMPKSVYGKPQKSKFEKIMVYSVEHPYEYLERLYGNWRELPPEEERIPKHEHVLDLNISFLDKVPQMVLDNIQ